MGCLLMAAVRRWRAAFVVEGFVWCFDEEIRVFVVREGERGEGSCVEEGLVVHGEIRVKALGFESVVLTEGFLLARLLEDKHLRSRRRCNSCVPTRLEKTDGI